MTEPDSPSGSLSRRSLSVTCSNDRRSHQVDDAVLASGLGSGHLSALCGRSILAAPMAAPIGPPCPLCAAVVDLELPRQRRFRAYGARAAARLGPDGGSTENGSGLY
jgi:hypothetical protein